MKIVQFGLPYSPNLGDGVIAECFAHGVARAVPEAMVQAIDLSGREDFGDVVVRNRSAALALLRRLPRPLRHRLVQARLGRVLARATPRWRAALAGADLAVIGGGQLLSDADLNFPLKLAHAARLAREAGVPVVVHAAGVARNWSPQGTALFRELLTTDLRSVGLRDAESCAAWLAQIGPDAPAPRLTRDPGLLAAGAYPQSRAPDPVVGLCVSDPGVLSYHAEQGTPGASIETFSALALTLAARGHRVRLFCNGAAEDADALALVAQHASNSPRAGQIEAAPVPDRPAALAAIVAGCRATLAHRLHACILAYAFDRPVIGLGWDRKVESFFDSVDAMADFAPAGTPVSTMVDQFETALARPASVGADRRDQVRAEAQRAIADVTACLRPPEA